MKQSREEPTQNSVANVAETLADSVSEIPPVVTIYAMAVVEDSPYVTLADEELDSLRRFLTCKDHLMRNIAHIEFNHLSSRELRSRFKHIIDVKIHVKTANLWEGARSYIWRHIGNDTWTRTNGTRIELVKIHQKG